MNMHHFSSGVDVDEARRIASEWHGGQWSALYAFASSGMIPDPESLDIEVLDCAHLANHMKADDRRDIERLRMYLDSNALASQGAW